MSTIDSGLLSPVAAGHDDAVSDERMLRALVDAERSLTGAYVDLGLAPADALAALEGLPADAGIDPAELAVAAAAGGNPVIPLVPRLRAAVPESARVWVHRGATSQDILDTAVMLLAAGALPAVDEHLARTVRALDAAARAHADDVSVARTLTQHAVPTTIGARLAGWSRGIETARRELRAVALPAQLAGAGGTLASFALVTGSHDAARALVAAFARRAGLRTPDAPWHVDRAPVTRLGDALARTTDALGKLAADVATLSRSEIAEVAEGTGGGSSAMPHKQNPARAVLIRSAALRAPQLAATLHLAAALAVDERPDGAWHAEWPTLRELLRLALGASAHAAALVEGLRIDTARAAETARAADGILAERDALAGPIAGAAAGDPDPAGYLGLAGDLAREASDAVTRPDAAKGPDAP